ncbi:hypothetical protein OG985_50325 (plasmid) [Streptomyces sp. NBC_00289]|uniref:hypothetical protein n=1 Tax=Streptomyces sp. NBC_00289 TaxID=2975703 RepID=UPI002F90FAA4
MANTRRLDREIALAARKLEAAKQGEMWPLTGSERRRVLTALAGGSYKVARGKSPGRAERKLDAVTSEIQSRLSAELTALQTAKQQIITQAATAKAAKKTESKWW